MFPLTTICLLPPKRQYNLLYRYFLSTYSCNYRKMSWYFNFNDGLYNVLLLHFQFKDFIKFEACDGRVYEYLLVQCYQILSIYFAFSMNYCKYYYLSSEQEHKALSRMTIFGTKERLTWVKYEQQCLMDLYLLVPGDATINFFIHSTTVRQYFINISIYEVHSKICLMAWDNFRVVTIRFHQMKIKIRLHFNVFIYNNKAYKENKTRWMVSNLYQCIYHLTIPATVIVYAMSFSFVVCESSK